MIKRKGISPIVSIALLLVVVVVSTIGFQTWYNSYQSTFYVEVNSEISLNDDFNVEGIYEDILYITTDKSESVLSVSVNSIDCSISGSYSGLEKINISNCLDLVSGRVAQVMIVTPSRVISSSQYLKEIRSSVSVDSNSCYDSSFVNTIGNESPCLDMLIVNRTMLDGAIADGTDYYITFGGTNYTFGDSSYNVFTGQVTDMSNMFSLSSFNQPIENWDISSVTDMTNMFFYAGFNQSLSNWSFTQDIDLSGMFYGSSYNNNISGWNMTPITDISSMFEESPSFNGDISSWDVSNIENMDSVFGYTIFDQDISSWDVSSVTDMYRMFTNSEFNQDISSWNVSSVIAMGNMFSQASNFNQNLSGWDMGQVITCSQFNSSTPSWILPKPETSACIAFEE
jgi:surface protein